MRSTQQRDLLLETDARRAAAWRQAAETALYDPHWTERERQERVAYYLTQANRFEHKEAA